MAIYDGFLDLDTSQSGMLTEVLKPFPCRAVLNVKLA